MQKRILTSISIAAFMLAVTISIHAQEARPGGQPEGERGERGGERGGFQRRDPLLSALDANGDNVIDAKEIAGAADALKKLDKNNDGKITQDELRPAIPQRGPMQAGGNSEEMVTRLMQFDKNADGKLSKDELPERMQNMMEKGDLNKDGFLDKDEIRKVAQSQAAAAPARRGGERGERD
jgi:hypothetical protein